MGAQKNFKYWAFISYSHADKKWGDWLHKSLETYRIPRHLVGKHGREAVVPKRMFPVFKDREELSCAACLPTSIGEALQDSRYLIVICSPRSADSDHVCSEIRHYKGLGREDRVRCLIVDGEPHAASKPGCFEEECFPKAVRYRVDDKGELTDSPVEPIAADMRMVGDRRKDAQLKLISGLLGIDFDELKQRDKRRRRTRLATLACAALVVSMLLVNQWRLSGQNTKLEGILTTDSVSATASRKETSLAKAVSAGQAFDAQAMFAQAEGLLGQGEADHALKWYRLAAAEGASRALYKLATIYRSNGYGIDAEPVKALAYLLAAQQQGVEVSADELAEFSRGLDALKLETARELANTF